MKKILTFLLFFVLMINVKAEVIANHYDINIVFNENKVFEIEESFSVSDANEKKVYEKKLYGNIYDIETNVEDYGIQEDKYSKTIYYNLKNDKEYYIKYKKNDRNTYKDKEKHNYSFDKEDFIYKKLNISYSSKIPTNNVDFRYNERVFDKDVDGNTYLFYLERELNENDNLYFSLELEVNRDYSKYERFIDSINDFDNPLLVSEASFVFIIIVTIIALLFKPIRKGLSIGLIVILIASIIFYYYSSEYEFAGLFMIIYAPFYMICFTIRTKERPIKLFVILFLGFHSFFFTGFGVGSIAGHIINNLNIYIVSEMFANFVYKGKLAKKS